MNDQLQALRDFLDTEKGQESIKEFGMKIHLERQHTLRWVEKLRLRYENRIDELIELLCKKYSSREYTEREYKMGVEPRDPLLWLVFEYARLYCNPCEDEKYLNPFTGDAYYIGSFVIQIMHGQGSVIRIDKQTEND